MLTSTKYLFLFVLCSLLFSTGGQAQYWMQKGGSLTVDEGYDIGVDGSGNTYTVGYFTGSASFGSTTLNSAGGTDVFLVKTNNQGVYQWAVKAGGSGADRGTSIKVDASGNSYITGYYNGTASFGSTSITSEGLQDIFVAKYNASGALQWVSSAGGSLADAGSGVSFDNSGNVIVTGDFRDSASFGSTTLVSSGGTDAFISKLSSTGAFLWTEHGAGINSNRGIDVDCDNSGNIYAIGQFSGTITFDVTHTNTMFNVVYVIKYNSSGSEQWFRIIGAGNSNIANSIATDASGNSYLTGDFTGTTTFFGSTNTNLSGNYTNCVFVAKYNSSGALQWASSSSSDSDLSSRSVAFDGSGNAYIAGHFGCRLDDYSDEYGEGIFNSVGYNDVFVSKFSNSGSWEYSRHAGGKADDHAFGVDVNSNGNIHYTGSFTGNLNIPTSSNFIGSNLNNWTEADCSGNSPYCDDANYGDFHRMSSAGNLDVVIANCFDPDREPYDYYKRSGSSCIRDVTSVCINNGCPDTASACQLVSLQAYPDLCTNIGPNLSYQWSSNSQNSNANISTSGTHWVIESSEDGCFSTTDSIEVIVLPPPPKPTISDDVVVNTNAQVPQQIEICGPDSVLLTGGGFGSSSFTWTGPGLGSGSTDNPLQVTESGTYNFNVTDSNGCFNSTSVIVEIYDPLDSFILAMNAPDSVTICENEIFEVWIYDSVQNPNGDEICLNQMSYNVNTTWVLTPSIPASEQCETTLGIAPQDSGYLTIDATFIRYTPCDTDTHYVSHTLYITVLPKPQITPFFLTLDGSHFYCPGDSIDLNVTGGPNYLWNGENINGSTDSTVTVWTTGFFGVQSSVSETNSFGCTNSYTASLNWCVDEKPQPELDANSTLICPGDSVALTCSHLNTGDPCYLGIFSGDYHWEGPSGPIATNAQTIYVTEPGSYYCIFNDGDSCDLQTNTVTLSQYATPQLLATGDLVLCDGDSISISVVSNAGSLIEWQSPLSGSGTMQTVHEPGTYTCKITACGIETFASIVVLAAEVSASILGDTHLCDIDTTVLHANPGMDTYTWFPGGQTSDSIIITQAGQFVLVTTDTNDCMAVSDTFHVLQGQDTAKVTLDGYPVFCVGDSIVLHGSSNMSNYLWTPGGDTTQNLITYTPGTYTLSTLDTNDCPSAAAPVSVTSPSTVAPFNIEGDTAFCEGGYVIFNATGKGFVSYTWSPDTVLGKTLFIQESGTYALTTIDTFGCVAHSNKVSVYVEPSIKSAPQVSDTIICRGNAVTLEATADVGEIRWYDDTGTELLETGPSYTTPVLSHNALYYVWSALSLCESKNVPVLVEVQNCENINVPNVLTPNGDGINDVWRVALEEHTCFNCYIYNRWGELIFTSNYINMGWDGRVTNTDDLAAEGVYYYIVDYCRYDGSEAQQRGVVHLMLGGKR